MSVAKKSTSQAAMKASVTRKHSKNRRAYENGVISLGTLRSLNAAVTVRARKEGYRG